MGRMELRRRVERALWSFELGVDGCLDFVFWGGVSLYATLLDGFCFFSSFFLMCACEEMNPALI